MSHAYAGGLKPTSFFLVRNLKPAADQQHIQIGVRAQGAPMRALAKQAIDSAVDDNPGAAEVVDYLRQMEPISDEELALLNANEIKQQLLALPGLTTEQEAQIQEHVTPSNEAHLKNVIKVLQDKEEAIVFGLRPFAMLNFPGVRATVEVPVAGFFLENETAFALGNANLELAFAHSMSDDSPINMGLGYGLHVYAPTGTERSNALAFQNLLDAPAYLHEYLTPAVFMNFGIQMPLLNLAFHGEIIPMIAKRGNPRHDLMISGGYGLALMLDLEILKVQTELAGRISIKDAEALESLYFLAGASFDLVFMELDLAFVMPMLSLDATSTGALPSADVGSATDYTFMARLGFGL
jgi:hypothetical protein